MHGHDRADGLILCRRGAQAHLQEATSIAKLVALQGVPLALSVMDEQIDVSVIIEVRSDHPATII
jgi:hypothetical protein